ncbi:MAG: hypothetical protein ACW97W_12170 [Candidatus Hodarchaeales archaeon]|jgi:hypothetical protein
MKRNKIKLKMFTFLLLGSLLLILLTSQVVSATEQSNDLTLSFTNLADPGDDHYEGWIIVDGTPKSTGKFTLNAAGNIVDLEDNVINKFSVEFDQTLATKFVLSLEPEGDTDSAPSAVKPLAGAIVDDSASLTHNIGVDISTISGGYILASPTNASITDLAGIWFLDPTSGTPVEGLMIPDLSNTDWVYEGWVVFNGTPVTTGKFDNASMADDFDEYSGMDAGPPFPGEDFTKNAPSGLSFPAVLNETTVVISIEPRMDNSPAPFQFKPLVGSVPSNPVDHMFYTLEDKTSTIPTGMLVISATGSNTTPFLTFGALVTTIFILGIGYKIKSKGKKNS